MPIKKNAKPTHVKSINQCLTHNCEAVLQCHKDNYAVPDLLLNSFSDCLLRAMQSGFPFEFWREEHPDLAGIVDLETMGAKTAVYLSTIDSGLFKLYFPIIWTIPRGVLNADSRQHLTLSLPQCKQLEQVLNCYFPETDAVVVSHPIMDIENIINYPVSNFRNDNAYMLNTRHRTGSWSFVHDLAIYLPTTYLESGPEDIHIIVAYEAMLYTKGTVLHSTLEDFNPNNLELKRDTDIILSKSFSQLDHRLRAYPQRWVTPNMLPWLDYLQGSAIKAATIKMKLFGDADYTTNTTDFEMQIMVRSKTTDNTLSIPYYSGLSYQMQAGIFFTAFAAYCLVMANS